MAFAIVTDSGCNLSPELIEQHKLNVIPLHLTSDEAANVGAEAQYASNPKLFYEKMREGVNYKTSLCSIPDIVSRISIPLKRGEDILYIGFSSQLSSTFDTVSLVMHHLENDYPERTLIAIDSLAASSGLGILVMQAASMADQGRPLNEVAQWLERNKLKCAHWFTVDDLRYLVRGGRVTKAEGYVGAMLNVKPVMHVDNEGRLVPVEKVRGRKKSIKALIEHLERSALQPINQQTIFIAHGDCAEEADALADEIRRQLAVETCMISYVSPEIGAHSGPGTLALFFMADKR